MTVTELKDHVARTPLDRPDIMVQLLSFHQSAEEAESVAAIQALYVQHLVQGAELCCPEAQISIPFKPELSIVKSAPALEVVVDASDTPGVYTLAIAGKRHSAITLMLSMGEGEEPTSALLTFTELITEQFRLFLRAHNYVELVDQAEHTDTLTLLPNRRSFEIELRNRCDGFEQFALLLINLDRFSRINDVMGPEAGDELLIQVASRLAGVLGSSRFLARINGDEFAILLDGADEQAAMAMAARLHNAMGPGIKIADRVIRCFASIGITLCPTMSLRPSELLRGARLSMSDAKRRQTGSLVYTGEFRADLSEQLLIESHLEAAIEGDQFELAAQPIYDVYSGQLSEIEILLRWHLPGHGAISPERFIGVAEDIGLSEKLDRYVMAKAMAMTEGVDLPVSVNLAAPTLYSASFTAFVESLLNQHRRSPRLLGLEITERIIARPDAARDTVEALGSMGVHIAIDDFGIGYSSLGILPELPISRLKIDKKFLLGKDGNPRYEEVIIGILRMASALGMESLVEGVEAPELLSWLRQVGCDFAQGFGLARPAPLARVLEGLSKNPEETHIGRSDV